MQDTEMFSLEKAATMETYSFNPAAALPRLGQFEKMYERYRIIFMTIKFVPATATTDSGSVTFGICPGKVNTAVKTANDILKLRPSRCVAVWQGATISLGQTIDSQRFLHCGEIDNDGVAFTLYVWWGGTTVTGHFQVSYKVELAYPKVF